MTTDGTARADVTVGIDFGTSTTKVAFRELTGQQSVVLLLDNVSPFWPSEVHLDGGRIYFGPRPAGNVQSIRWLKMLLADESVGRVVPVRHDMVALAKVHGLDVQSLVALFLTHVVTEARQAIDRYYASNGHPHPHCTFNLSAPLEAFREDQPQQQSNSRAIQQQFEMALYHADILAGKETIQSGMELSDALIAYRSLVEIHGNLPGSDERVTFVIPEIHAAVAGAIQSHQLENGTYAVVDVGAGTTDVAVFLYGRNVRKEGRRAIAYFGDQVGSDASVQIDTALADMFRKVYPDHNFPVAQEFLPLVQAAKERSNGGTIGYSSQHALAVDSVEQAIEGVITRIFRHFKRTLLESLLHKYRKALHKEFVLILLGGGSRFAPLACVLRERLPDANTYPKLRAIPVEFSLAGRLMILKRGVLCDTRSEDAQMLALAYGLTTHIARMPDLWTPTEVEADVVPEENVGVWIRDDD